MNSLLNLKIFFFYFWTVLCICQFDTNIIFMTTISYETTYLYFFAGLFPIITSIICIMYFCFGGHYSNGWINEKGIYRRFDDSLIGISEFMVPYPESKIFSVFIAFESVVIACVFYVRQAIIEIYSKNPFRNRNGFLVLKVLLYVFNIMAPIGLFLFGSFTVDDNLVVHKIGKHLFILSTILFSLVTDMTLKAMKLLKNMIYSIILFVLLIIYIVLMIVESQIEETGSLAQNIIVAFDFIIFFALFLKVLLFVKDVPKHNLTLTI